MTERKTSLIRKKISGIVIRTMDDPYDKELHAWVDVEVDQGDIRRLLVTQRYRQENRLKDGRYFSWKQWTFPLNLLNFIANPVQDITKEMKNSGIDLNKRPSRDV